MISPFHRGLRQRQPVTNDVASRPMVGEATEYNSASKYVAPFDGRKSTPRLPEKSGGRFTSEMDFMNSNFNYIILCVFLLVTACAPIRGSQMESLGDKERLQALEAKTEQELCDYFVNPYTGEKTKQQINTILQSKGRRECANRFGLHAYVGVPESQREAGLKPKNYKVKATEYIREKLKDPDSMKNIKVGDIRIGICRVGGLMFLSRPIGPTHEWWVVPVSYNATNSFGGYVGQQENYVWFRGDNIMGQSESSYVCPIF